MSGRWHLLHPMVVHFPIALLLTGAAARLWSGRRRAPGWLEDASTALLWLGAASAWAALGLGHLAEDSAAHVPPAWRVLHDHEGAAWWTAGWFTALSAAELWRRRLPVPRPYARAATLAAWLLGLALLGRTAYLGGELVFRFGMGVGEALGEEAIEEALDEQG
ncbi:MAG: hypothetical protein HY554_07800 [Elusimicrobia bacterium]|nr:hypothetical protein [Elusimicrobiota bacterium]